VVPSRPTRSNQLHALAAGEAKPLDSEAERGELARRGVTGSHGCETAHGQGSGENDGPTSAAGCGR
jgi:hypothetical protein